MPSYGLLTRYVQLGVARAPGMPGTFSPPPRVSYPDMHHGTCVTHAPWCMPGSLTSGFLLSRCREKRSRHSQRMRNPQFYVSGKRPKPSHWVFIMGNLEGTERVYWHQFQGLDKWIYHCKEWDEITVEVRLYRSNYAPHETVDVTTFLALIPITHYSGYFIRDYLKPQ